MKLKLAVLIIAILCLLEAFYYPIRDVLPVDMSGGGEVYYKVVVTEEVTTNDYIDAGLYVIGSASLLLFAFLYLKTRRDKK
ncbi:hypothetical protein ISG33_14350 [Glaciecola sp. MH2013]|uniref:hypothetical protein n=1 Tax=Glaciecola sp. MH2013 TaxID=2785524 RepID=UPI0018A06FB1|nr:hypothetical protein [Glaciecola sp. MH2013]MBF7074583.1 hypothetical protein [Glaciecola sp. MH2013]